MGLKKTTLFFICCIVIFITACEEFDKNLLLTPWAHHWQAPLEYDDSDATKFLNVAAVSFDVNLSPDINRSKMIG